MVITKSIIVAIRSTTVAIRSTIVATRSTIAITVDTKVTRVIADVANNVAAMDVIPARDHVDIVEVVDAIIAVSYTHLTLPTIYSV